MRNFYFKNASQFDLVHASSFHVFGLDQLMQNQQISHRRPNQLQFKNISISKFQLLFQLDLVFVIVTMGIKLNPTLMMPPAVICGRFIVISMITKFTYLHSNSLHLFTVSMIKSMALTWV